jgi:phage-related protein
MKDVEWVGNSKERLKQFPEEAKREGGRQLRFVQGGMQPNDWRPMSTIGAGVIEIRLHEPHEHRILYAATFPEAIYVLHAFEKKTRQTRQFDIEIARKNYDYIKEYRKKIKKVNC